MNGYLLQIFCGNTNRRWERIRLSVSTLFVACWLGGCTTAPKVVYPDYTLANVSSNKTTPLKTTLGVFPVEVASWLNSKSIIWSDGGVRLQSSLNSHWGEPLPALLTEVMAQNLRRLTGTQTWVNIGPWTRDKRPAAVIFLHVQSLAVVGQQLQLSVAWTLEDKSGKRFAQRDKVYTLLAEEESVHNRVLLLSQAWGQVAADLVQAVQDHQASGA